MREKIQFSFAVATCLMMVTGVVSAQDKPTKDPFQRYKPPTEDEKRREDKLEKEAEERRRYAEKEKQSLLKKLNAEIKSGNWDRGLDIVEQIDDLGFKYDVQNWDVDPRLMLNVAYPGKKYAAIINYFDKYPRKKSTEYLGEYIHSCAEENKKQKATQYISSLKRIPLGGISIDQKVFPLSTKSGMITSAYFYIGIFAKRLSDNERLEYLLKANVQKPKCDWIVLAIAYHYRERKMYEESLLFYKRLQRMETALAKREAAFGIAACEVGLLFQKQKNSKS